MTVRNIRIILSGQSLGTKAVVTTKPMLGKARDRTYVCDREAGIMPATWIEENTGLRPNESLVIRLNEAAQAAARLSILPPTRPPL